jgi:hypothetical protein
MPKQGSNKDPTPRIRLTDLAPTAKEFEALADKIRLENRASKAANEVSPRRAQLHSFFTVGSAAVAGKHNRQ